MQIQTTTGNLATWANDINHHHEQACSLAGEAINHAIEAGKLLISVKARLPHGEFGNWIERNLKVTQRQAQRYVGAAQGKRVPMRSIASNTTPVSLLPDWLSTDENVWMTVVFAEVIRKPITENHKGVAVIVDYEESHPVLWLQRTPVKELKPEARETPYYDFIFIDANRTVNNNWPISAAEACCLASQAVAGRATKGGRTANPVSWTASDSERINALANIDWNYTNDAPGQVLSMIDIRKECALLRENQPLKTAHKPR